MYGNEKNTSKFDNVDVAKAIVSGKFIKAYI